MANKIKLAEETAKTWTDSGGDYAMDLGGLAADAVRVGARGDLGTSPRSRLYAWTFVVDGFDTAPVIGEAVHLYLALSDGTYAAGNVGTADAAGSTDALPNLLYLGSAIVQTTTAGDDLVIAGTVELSHRYVSPVVHNATADALLSTADAHKFILQPVPDELQ
jgi:hypothetical protein